MATRQWREPREEEYREQQREPVNHDKWDSIEAWAVAHGLTLTEAVEEGVSQDDDGTIHVPTGLWGWLEVEGKVK